MATLVGMDEKDTSIRIRISKKDKRTIDKRAAALGLSTSAWLRMLALTAPSVLTPPELVAKLGAR